MWTVIPLELFISISLLGASLLPVYSTFVASPVANQALGLVAALTAFLQTRLYLHDCPSHEFHLRCHYRHLRRHCIAIVGTAKQFLEPLGQLLNLSLSPVGHVLCIIHPLK